jgi:hypothetical protein
MSEKPEALRLAQLIEAGQGDLRLAAELRRLHALNGELLEALKRIDKEFRKYGRQHWPEAEKARATIKKAEGKV